MKTCGKCKHVGDYTTGPYSRNPHYCCELIWSLMHEEIRVNPNETYEGCPLNLEEFQTLNKKLQEMI